MTGLGRVMLIVAIGAGMPASDAITSGQAAEWAALDSVYYTALLSGRDPDAAVRKARFNMNTLSRDLGMTRPAAASDAARFLLRRGGTLCGGG